MSYHIIMSHFVCALFPQKQINECYQQKAHIFKHHKGQCPTLHGQYLASISPKDSLFVFVVQGYIHWETLSVKDMALKDE